MQQPSLERPTAPLPYADAVIPWYRRRRWQRGMLLAAVLVLLLWIPHGLGPMWERYRFYLAQQQLVRQAWSPAGEAVRFSATQPYAHAAGAFQALEADFWARRRSVGSGDFGAWGQAGGTATPIFSAMRRTAGGQERLVQVFASPVKVGGQDQGIVLAAVAVEPVSWRWVVNGNRRHRGDIFYGEALGRLMQLTPISVTGGRANPADASEVDVTVLLDGQSTELPFHVIDLPTPTPTPMGARVVIAAPIRQWLGSGVFRGSAQWTLYSWPGNGKVD